MNTILIILLVGFMAMVLFSLVKGVVAFLRTTKIDLETGDGETVTEMQVLQNKAMFARIKYQALAIVVVAILLAMGGGRS
uniref:hypothetical protein n=1 Tax=Parerythrobacter lutipelagi TaxID=1964208 RepID=UPI0010F8D2AE|nr:hypothetical protein [Parerythrobacter lutipelagi]